MADKQETTRNYHGEGIGLGLAIGVALGAAFGNVGLGISFGLIFGATLDYTRTRGQAFGDDES